VDEKEYDKEYYTEVKEIGAFLERLGPPMSFEERYGVEVILPERKIKGSNLEEHF
jgi:hypothetical protein